MPIIFDKKPHTQTEQRISPKNIRFLESLGLKVLNHGYFRPGEFRNEYYKKRRYNL